MKFYQENKINPLASCLPLVLQLPVFISLFYMLRTDLKKHICGPQLVQYFNRHPAEATKYKHAIPVDSFVHLPAKFIERHGLPDRRAGFGQIPLHPRHHQQGDGLRS